jgi:serine/threonine-protein kinase PknG
VLGVPLVASRLRFAAEKELRTCARMAPTEDERFALVDQANAIRPLTIL